MTGQHGDIISAKVAGASPGDKGKPFSASAMFQLQPVNSSWEDQITWCLHNVTHTPGETNCTEQHAVQPNCIVQGGRSCLIVTAVGLARSDVPGSCLAAYNMTLVCQCHNGD